MDLEKPSKNFGWHEFLVSADYPELAAKMSLSDQDKVKIFYLCRIILQPVRDKFGRVVILSGKRSQELNKAIDGTLNSDHLFHDESVAADFTTPEAKLDEVYRFLIRPRHLFGQLIKYDRSNFIHVSLPTRKNQGSHWAWNR